MQKEKEEIISRAKKYGRVQSLMKHINERTLKWAFQKMNQCKIGGVSAEYEKDLNENIRKLLLRMKNFSYYPQTIHRNHTIYSRNNARKYEVRSFEDEIVKNVIKEILEAIYESKIFEQKFLEPERKLRCTGKTRIYIAYLSVNVKAFLGYIDYELLIGFLEQDIADRNFIRYIRRFLDKGIMDFEKQSELEILQRDVFSEMLCNVYLYYTLQTWAESIKNKIHGKMYVVKTEEEFRFLFHNVADAQRVYRVLLEKLEKLGIRSAEDIGCVLSVLGSDRVKYLQEYPQRHITRSRRKRVHS